MSVLVWNCDKILRKEACDPLFIAGGSWEESEGRLSADISAAFRNYKFS